MSRSPKLIVCVEPFGKREVPLRKRVLRIGRGNDQDVCLPDRKISSAHALLERTRDGFLLTDLGSTNGTYVNGAFVEGKVRLRLGDELRFGNTLALLTDRSLAELRDWPEKPTQAKGPEVTELELEPAVKTVKYRVLDVERQLLSSEDGTGSIRLRRKLEVLHRVTVLTRGSTDGAKAIMERALELLLEVVAADRGVFYLTDAEGQPRRAASRLRRGASRSRKVADSALPTETSSTEPMSGGRWEASRSLLNQVLETGEAIVIRDAREDQRFGADHSIHRTHIRSALAVPLLARDQVLGVLQLDKREARAPFDEGDLHLTVIVGQQVAASLHTARLFQAVRHANQELEKARDEILRWNQELEQKVAERTREVEEQAARIEELMQQKDQLIGMVAHDLRTPLAGLLGFAEVAMTGIDAGLEPERTKQDLEVIRSTALEMSELLNDLLDVSRLEAGKLSIDPRPFDLLDLIRTSAKRYEALAAQKGIAFSTRLPAGELSVTADPKRVGQILGNLISNAIKFSNPGGRVVLSVRREPERALVSVADTGQGISPSDAERIFSRYEQAEAQATAGEHGSGLGLSIAKKLIELHGGSIWVDSAPGEGALFTFALPL